MHEITSLFSIPSSPVPQSQKLEIERLFLHFYSIRTNQYGLNPGAKPGSYYVPIPYFTIDVSGHFISYDFKVFYLHNVTNQPRRFLASAEFALLADLSTS